MPSKTKKIVFVYDTEKGKEIASTLSDLAISNNFEVINFCAGENILEPCVGCFNCWIKTPGICCQTKTNSFAYLKEIISANYVVNITQITFSGFSANMKAYLERSLPLSHPFFTKRSGEMHHQKRYKENAQMIAIGYDPTSIQAEKNFCELISRNLINSGIKKSLKFKSFTAKDFCFIYRNENQDIKNWFSSLLEVA